MYSYIYIYNYIIFIFIFSYISQLEIQTGNHQLVVTIKGVDERAQAETIEREENKGQYPEKNDTEECRGVKRKYKRVGINKGGKRESAD